MFSVIERQKDEFAATHTKAFGLHLGNVGWLMAHYLMIDFAFFKASMYGACWPWQR